MLRQRTSRTTRSSASASDPSKAKAGIDDMASSPASVAPDDRTPLLSHPHEHQTAHPSLPTTISSLDAAFEPTLPISPSSSSSILGDSQVISGHAAMDMSTLSRRSQWITLAVASGGCAAFNGVFAKLTTTDLTTTIATSVAGFFGLGDGEWEKVVEVVIRGMFFVLNLVFNGIMWTLFTKALARGTSTTQVSIINTSSNFMVTAVLGFIIFSESLPPLWWLGAALLVAGNVIIGRREEHEAGENDAAGHAAAENGAYQALDSEEVGDLLGDSLELAAGEGLDSDEVKALKRKAEREAEDDILDLGDEETPHPSQNAGGSH